MCSYLALVYIEWMRCQFFHWDMYKLVYDYKHCTLHSVHKYQGMDLYICFECMLGEMDIHYWLRILACSPDKDHLGIQLNKYKYHYDTVRSVRMVKDCKDPLEGVTLQLKYGIEVIRYHTYWKI